MLLGHRQIAPVAAESSEHVPRRPHAREGAAQGGSGNGVLRGRLVEPFLVVLRGPQAQLSSEGGELPLQQVVVFLQAVHCCLQVLAVVVRKHEFSLQGSSLLSRLEQRFFSVKSNLVAPLLQLLGVMQLVAHLRPHLLVFGPGNREVLQFGPPQSDLLSELNDALRKTRVAL